MSVRREFSDRGAVEVEILSALVDRGAEGMTVLELRAAVDADIDAIETALAELCDDGLVSAETTDGRVVLLPDDTVVAAADEGDDDRSVIDQVRTRLGL